MAMLTDSEIAAMGTAPISTEPYCSEDYFKLEAKNLFAKVWLFAGREIDLPAAGDFLVKEILPCKASVLITRADDGRLRAFHNVCSHRQAKVVFESRGNAQRFACRYHGWGYNLKGELKVVPDEAKFTGLDKANCGLTPVAIDSSNGFIFINLDPQPAQTLKQYMAGIDERLAQHAFAEWTSGYRIQCDIPVNWKCVIDAFQETYHLSFAHANSVTDRSTGPGNPLGHPIGFEIYGPHRMMGIWGNLEHKLSPFEMFAVMNGGVISQGVADTARNAVKRHPNWQMDVHGLFPNYFIDTAPSFFITHEVQPISAGMTRWVTHATFPPAKNAAQRVSQEFSVAAYRDTAVEDISILSTQQQAMLSGAKTHIQFQANEVLCRHFIATVDRYARGLAAVRANG